ncbi:MAG: hypothetical protein ACXQTP_00880 [Candidatus Methanofastidiosia archaeon]
MPSWPDVETYVEVLKLTYAAIKEKDQDAKVIIPGLAGNYGRIFAFVAGCIDDEDAGVWKGVKYQKNLLALVPGIKKEKEGYEYILQQGGYFDIVDIHLYEPKETFIEGKLDWIKNKMEEYGYQKPIWVCEGGGPFKNSPGDTSPQGDLYFGTWTAKENAEFVIKLFVMSAANGVERQRWGLGSSGERGYWQGPWKVMGLLDQSGNRKPAYYTFKLMREKLRDFISVNDLSIGDIKIYEFILKDTKIYVAWNRNGGSDYEITDLSDTIGKGNYVISYIVTEIVGDVPVIKDSEIYSSAEIPLSITPVFIEKI